MKAIEIVYQNDEILVVNKPSGMSSQGGEESGLPLDEVLCKQLMKKVYLAHRLDRDTSGLMIAAKSKAAAAKWTALVSSKEVKKEYIALCFNVPRARRGTITMPIAERRGRDQKGRVLSAATQYEVLCTGKAEIKEQTAPLGLQNGDAPHSLLPTPYPLIPTPFSLILARLLTGRNHQIRIHLASIGCPIAGDDKHGDFAMNRALKKAFGTKRLCLASCALALPSGIVLKVPPPEHITQLMRMLNMDILTP